MRYERKTTSVEAMRFPDDGPGQHAVAEWVRKHGVEANLFDKLVQNNVETSTKARWRWRAMYLGMTPVEVGDWVVKEDNDNKFYVYSNLAFRDEFKTDNQ